MSRTYVASEEEEEREEEVVVVVEEEEEEEEMREKTAMKAESRSLKKDVHGSSKELEETEEEEEAEAEAEAEAEEEEEEKGEEEEEEEVREKIDINLDCRSMKKHAHGSNKRDGGRDDDAIAMTVDGEGEIGDEGEEKVRVQLNGDGGWSGKGGAELHLGNEEDKEMSNTVKKKKTKKQKGLSKKKLEKMQKEYKRRGIVYLSRIPPNLKPLKLRQMLSQYGEILRIYLAPEKTTVRRRRQRSGGDRGKHYTEGWVEFANKRLARSVAEMLNGQPMGGKRRSAFHFDLWNIKYLHRFKWDNLTEEIAYRNAVREQRLAAEISVAKKERDFYLARVDQSKGISEMAARRKKRQARSEEHGDSSKVAGSSGVGKSPAEKKTEGPAKVLRKFAQKRGLIDSVAEETPRLPMDLLAGIFGGSQSSPDGPEKKRMKGS